MKSRIVIIFATVMFCFSVANGCSCSDPSVRTKIRESDLIFSGEVVKFENLNETANKGLFSRLFFYKVLFKVEKRWKGKKKSQIEAYAQYDQPGMCGDLNLDVGQKLLIYAPFENGNYLIYRDCGPNRTLKYAEDEVKKLNSFPYRLFSVFYPYPKF
jgi:hypothetical protein